MARAYLETLADLPWNTFSGQAADRTNGKSEPKDTPSGSKFILTAAIATHHTSVTCLSYSARVHHLLLAFVSEPCHLWSAYAPDTGAV